jgi:hypothetical protein
LEELLGAVCHVTAEAKNRGKYNFRLEQHIILVSIPQKDAALQGPALTGAGLLQAGTEP